MTGVRHDQDVGCVEDDQDDQGVAYAGYAEDATYAAYD